MNTNQAPSSQPALRCPFAKMANPEGSLADTLREQTKDAHTRAERHSQQARLVKGEATRADYAAWLGQMLHVWRALDRGMATKAAEDSRLAAMLKPYHPHADRVQADLEYLAQTDGLAAEHAELPATRKFVEFVEAAAIAITPDIVGVWYVLEGSANGGRYIAKALSRSLGLAGPDGLRSLDPHGEAQRDRWQAWRTDLDAQPWTTQERSLIVAAACVTFAAVYDLLDGLTQAAAMVDSSAK